MQEIEQVDPTFPGRQDVALCPGLLRLNSIALHLIAENDCNLSSDIIIVANRIVDESSFCVGADC